jgi:hypothetical protein
MIQSNWQASNRPQQKSKKTPRKHQQWLAAHKVLVERLRKGINVKDPARDGGVFWYNVRKFRSQIYV